MYIYSGYVTASEYYVSAAPNGGCCPPSDLPCHDLSYYIANYSSYFTDDAIFYFLPGTHTLQSILNISDVSNITLQGLGRIEQGFHETVMQSTSVIRCSDSIRSGIQVNSSSDVVLESLTIANCEFSWHPNYSASLSLVGINNVTLKWLSIQNSSGNGLILLNTYDVLIANSSFANNGDLETFVGNVYIKYNDQINRLSRVIITKSNFTRGLGYGLYLWCDHDNEPDVMIENSIFSNNNASLSGGGVAIVLGGGGSIEISSCTICNNTAQKNGGGVMIYSSQDSSVEFINCTIYNNIAQSYGGGMEINLYGNGYIDLSNCNIHDNTAQKNGGGVRIYSLQDSSVEFIDCTICDNTAQSYGGGMYIISYNNSSQIIYDGHNMFVNNSGVYGGGIALYDSSQLLLNQNTNISFINNHASVSGGGIFADNTTGCSFKVIPHHDSIDTKTVLYFVNNTADISGDVLYGGKIDDCMGTLYFDHLFQYPQQTGLSVVSSDPIQVCFCELNRPNCSNTNVSISVTPGFDVNVSLATVGILNSLTEGVIRLSSSDNSSIVQYNTNKINAICTNFIFTLRTNPSLNITQVYVTLESSIRDPLYDHYAKVIEVTIEPCPNGYPLVNDICACRPELNSGSISCDVNTQIITRDGDMWIGYEKDSHCLIVYPNCPFHYCNNSNISFTLNYPDPQCLHSRSGILCGQCSEGFSLVLGYNQCEKCSNDYIVLLIPFAVAGIALVIFVMVLNLTVSVGTINGLIFYTNIVKIYEPVFFPKGSVHFLSQFISWINLDLGIKSCFYHSMDSCSKMWLQFVFPAYVWLILILIIIPLRYSCKAVRVVGIQAIPVLTTMILLSYTKLIHTVFHALYFTHIPCSDGENNTVTLLRWYFDPNIHYLQGCHLPLFLFSLAVLILLIIPYTFYLLTIPLFEGPLSKYMCCCQKVSRYMKPFFDAYGGPYKDKCRFWTGFLLLIRVILSLVVLLDTDATASLDVLTSILIVIIFIYLLLKGMYRHYPLDYLEMYFILNLMFIAYMNAQTSNDNDDSKGQVSSIVLVSISFVVFCGIIFYHVWDHMLKSRLQQPITKIKRIFKKPPPPSTSNDMELPSTHPVSPVVETSIPVVSTEMTRESIMFDSDDY